MRSAVVPYDSWACSDSLNKLFRCKYILVDTKYSLCGSIFFKLKGNQNVFSKVFHNDGIKCCFE